MPRPTAEGKLNSPERKQRSERSKLTSSHDGVTCDVCNNASSIKGLRFKCLICDDYDLCQRCHESETITLSHLKSHPVQCILNAVDYEKFYGGEQYDTSRPLALTCPYCGSRGFDIETLNEHLTKDHPGPDFEPHRVLCPICCATTTGEPNIFFTNLTSHFVSCHPAVSNYAGLPVCVPPPSANSSNHLRAQAIFANLGAIEALTTNSTTQSSSSASGTSETMSSSYGMFQQGVASTANSQAPFGSALPPPPPPLMRIPQQSGSAILGAGSSRPQNPYGRAAAGLNPNHQRSSAANRRPPLTFFGRNVVIPSSSASVLESPRSSNANNQPGAAAPDSLQSRMSSWIPSLVVQPSASAASNERSPGVPVMSRAQRQRIANMGREEWEMFLDPLGHRQQARGSGPPDIWGNTGIGSVSNPIGSSGNGNSSLFGARRTSQTQKRSRTNETKPDQPQEPTQRDYLREQQEIDNSFSLCNEIIRQFEEEHELSDVDELARGLYAQELLLGVLSNEYEGVASNFRIEDFHDPEQSDDGKN